MSHPWEVNTAKTTAENVTFPGKLRMSLSLLKCGALRKGKIWAPNDTCTSVTEQERSWLSSYSHRLRMLWGPLSHCATTGGIPRKKITRFTYYMENFMSWLQCVCRAPVASPVFHSACKEGVRQYFWWVDPVKIIILLIVKCRGGKKDKLLESDKLLKYWS